MGENMKNNELKNLFKEHIKWSQQTFGKKKTYKACFAHMEREIDECRENPKDIEEYADILLLLFDAFYRGTGKGFDALVNAVSKKIKKNKNRKWNVSKDPNVPSFHKKKREKQ